MTTATHLVATWKHRGGSTVVLAKLSGDAYAISAPGSGGVFYRDSDEDAIEEVERRIASGWYSRDAWTTNYERQP